VGGVVDLAAADGDLAGLDRVAAVSPVGRPRVARARGGPVGGRLGPGAAAVVAGAPTAGEHGAHPDGADAGQHGTTDGQVPRATHASSKSPGHDPHLDRHVSVPDAVQGTLREVLQITVTVTAGPPRP